MRSKLMAALIGAAALSVLGGGYAVAGPLIRGKDVKNNSLTGRDIKNNSLTSRDIKRGSLRFNRLSKGTQALIRKAGTPGQNGANGAPGPPGQNGTNGTVGGAGGSFSQIWGIIHRNTIGSPDISLAAGPFVGAAANQRPPFGDGSLSFLVENNAGKPEKAAFGNQVDFAGQNPSELSQLGFRVFQTGESDNRAADRRNLPNISIEVDPNLSSTASNFSTLVWNPGPVAPADRNRWSGYRDATAEGDFYLTGAAGTASGCTLATPCTFTQVKTALNDGGDAASILTVGVTKGRDNEWQGSIDGLRVNNQVFDFEVGGVRTLAP